MKCMDLFQTCRAYVYICLRIYLSLLVKNCSGERSLSALKRIRNFLWSTLKDEKLKHLALMHVESSVLRALKFSSVMVLDQFLERLTREMFLWLETLCYLGLCVTL